MFILTEIVTPQQLETISAHSIIETWEMASIVNSNSLLHMLGFDEDEVNVSQLSKVLEEELRTLENDAHTNMMRALVALQSMELCSLRQVFRQQHEENVKLRADNKAANQRVALLAAEVDERHAMLEENCKQQVLQLEQRHTTVIRELTQRMSNDRDHWTNMSLKLEAEIKKLEQEEIKLKTELELIRIENSELEMEQQKAHLQITELLEKNIKLNEELANVETLRTPVKPENNERNVEDDDDDAAKEDKLSEDDEILHVMEKMRALQMENAQLRDKTDELTMEIENLHVDLARTKQRKKKSPTPAAVAPTSGVESADGDDQEAVSVGLATKRRGDSPSKTHITEESPRLGKQRKCSEGGEVSDNSGDWLALNSELQRCKLHEEELVALRRKIAQLEQETQATGGSTATTEAGNSRATTPETRCKELEHSLEQMQRAYEDCEDYWQIKLSEERQMFEKERQIYEDEQLESDKKFTELMEKVREYEEQFSKDGRLSPIDERDMLEQQYIELEAEAANLRNNSIRILEEKSQQINDLQCEVEDLRTRLGESVEILTGANEINSDILNSQLNVAHQVGQSPASSPISYLWNQSTIQEPLKTFEGATDEAKANTLSFIGVSPTHKATSR